MGLCQGTKIIRIMGLGLFCFGFGLRVLGISFNPPYSNSSYQCRCFPVFDAPLFRGISIQDPYSIHVKLCEFAGYIRDLKDYIEFFKTVLAERKGEKNLVKVSISEVPGSEQSKAIQKLIRSVQKEQYAYLFTTWNALKEFSEGNDKNLFFRVFGQDLSEKDLISGSDQEGLERTIAYTYVFLKEYVDVLLCVTKNILNLPEGTLNVLDAGKEQSLVKSEGLINQGIQSIKGVIKKEASQKKTDDRSTSKITQAPQTSVVDAKMKIIKMYESRNTKQISQKKE